MSNFQPVVARGSACRRDAGVRAGFTLVEILGVLVVLGLIATLVGVNWQAILPKTELHSAVRTLAAALQSTRSEAISRNQNFEVQYDLEKHRHRVLTPYRVDGKLAGREEDRTAQPWKPLPDTVRFDSITIDGVPYTRGIVRIVFDPLGTSNSHTVQLRQRLGETEQYEYTIEVQGLLGVISYHAGLFQREPAREDDFK